VARLPLVPGHEIVGRIVAIGPQRAPDILGRRLKEGDRFVWSYAWCGTCYWCVVAGQPTLCPNARMYGYGTCAEPPYLLGGFSEYAYVLPACAVLKVPEDLDRGLVAAATCSLRTVMHAFEAIGGVRPGDTVLVQGSGPVGLWATAGAARSLAREWGATDVADITKLDADQRRDMVRDRTDGRGADLVFECSGARTALLEGFGAIRPGGRYMVIGQAAPTPVTLPANIFTVGQLTVSGVRGADIRYYHQAMEFLLANGGARSFGGLIGAEYSLDDAEAAVDSVGALHEIKTVVVPNASLG
jgi:threonine dehydrogenase-like Zn-dependent dehydrogenase